MLILPAISKKCIYLDQSILSDLYVAAGALTAPDLSSEDPSFRLVSKLNEARTMQKLRVVVSDLHAVETAGVPNVEKQRAIWRFANALADGEISGDTADAFESELEAFISRELGPIQPITDKLALGLLVDEWNLYSPILLTNAWRLRLNADRIATRDLQQDEYLRIIKSQDEDSSACDSANDCVEFVAQRTAEEILSAIGHLRAVLAIGELPQPQTMDTIPHVPQLRPLGPPSAIVRLYCNIIQRCVQANRLPAMLYVLEREVRSRAREIFPSLALASTIEGELLWMWKQGRRRNLDAKRFSRNYGVSRNMDVSHLSTFVPRVDVVTTDRDMYNLCQSASIQAQLCRHRCKLMTGNQLSDIERWLDDLISGAESEEFEMTRRLAVGLSSAERKVAEEEQLRTEVMKMLVAKACEG